MAMMINPNPSKRISVIEENIKILKRYLNLIPSGLQQSVIYNGCSCLNCRIIVYCMLLKKIFKALESKTPSIMFRESLYFQRVA